MRAAPVLALAAALPAQWEPLAPGPFALGPHQLGLQLGPGWWGAAGSNLLLLHAGPRCIVFTDTAPWRLEMHVAFVGAIGPPCARGSRFAVCRDFCDNIPGLYYPRALSDGDPFDGSRVDFWLGDRWGGVDDLWIKGEENCPLGQSQRIWFVLAVDAVRLVPL